MVSFIILNWNGGQEVLRCLTSVFAQVDEQIECIVVDNGSTDGSIEAVRGLGSGVRLVLNSANRGFAAGMNQGLALARGDILVPTNQDVVLDPTFAREVRRVFDQDPTIGSVGGVIRRLSDDGPTNEFDAGGYYLSHRISAGSGLIGPLHEGQAEVFGVSGCCPALRASMLRDVRLGPTEYYDSSYFAYFEDIDLFFRAQLRGWRSIYAASVKAWHHRSSSSGGSRRFYQKPLWIQEHHFRNRYATVLKNCPSRLLIRIMPAVVLTELLLWPYLIVRSPRSVLPLAAAWYGFIRALPRLLGQRRMIQRRRQPAMDRLATLVRGF